MSSCLQNLSNAAVLAAYLLRNTSAPIPDWVLALPDPPRSGMEKMFEKFGSPTVFQYFRPQCVPFSVGYALVLVIARYPPHTDP